MARRAIAAFAVLAGLALIQPVGASNPWTKLHRPLHLPRLVPGASCPISTVDSRVAWRRLNIVGRSGIGRGPVYAGLGDTGGRLETQADEQFGGPWASGKLFWYVRRSYRGPVLIRGRRLDGSQSLGFNGARLPARELRIRPLETVSWEGQPAGSRGVPSFARIRSAGCYGVQIDGTSFSRIVVFTIAAP